MMEYDDEQPAVAEFVKSWTTDHEEPEADHVPVTLHDGTESALSLDTYPVIIIAQQDGHIQVSVNGNVNTLELGKALCSMGLDLQMRPLFE